MIIENLDLISKIEADRNELWGERVKLQTRIEE